MFCIWDKGETRKVQPEKILENFGFSRHEESNEEAQYINFSVKIYKADGLPRLNSGVMAHLKKTFSVEAAELLDPYVEVYFGGIKGITSKKKRTVTPCWNQQIVFKVKFPIPSQPLVIQVREDEIMTNNVVGTAIIDLDKISNSDKRGFLPTYGPCYMYLSESKTSSSNETDTSFRGRLLMALSSEIITNIIPSEPHVMVEPIAPLPQDTRGEVEFLLFACIRDATMIEKKAAERALRFSLQIGHIPEYIPEKTWCGNRHVSKLNASEKSNFMDSLNIQESDQNELQPAYCSSFLTPVTTNRRLYNIPIKEKKECLWLKSSWPDYRRSMYISNILEKAIQKIEYCLNLLHEYEDMKNLVNVEKLDTVLKDLEDSLSNFLQLLTENWRLFSSKTQLDKERWSMYKKCLEEVFEVAVTYRKRQDQSAISAIMAKVNKLLQELKVIKDDPQPALPDVIVWMENDQKRIGYSKIAARDLLYAAGDVERGAHCGKIRSIFFKPLFKKKTSSHVAKLDLYLWLGLEKHVKHCLEGLPQGFDSDVDGKEMGQIDYIPRVIHYYEKQIYELHAHIYQARFLPWSNMSKFPTPVAQLFMADKCLSTQIQESTLNPIWDETLVFSDLVFYGSKKEITTYSPDIVIEIFDYSSTGKSTCLCKGIIPVLSEENRNQTLLKWYNINSFDSSEITQVLAAFELFSVPGDRGDLGMFENKLYDVGTIMPIPQSIRPRLSPHRIEILFWGLRELKKVKLSHIEAPRIELECCGKVIQSSVIPDYSKHANFKKMIEIFDMDLPERETYFPALTIRLLECKSFGRRNILASHIIQHLHKYVVRPKGEILEQKFEENLTKQKDEVDYDAVLEHIAINIESSEHQHFHDSYIHQKVETVNNSNAVGTIVQDDYYNLDVLMCRIPWTKSEVFVTENDEEEQDWWSRYYISSMKIPQFKKSFPKSFSHFPKASTAGRRSTLGCLVKSTFDSHQPNQLKNFLDGEENAGNNVLEFSTSNLDAQGFTIYPCELENAPDFDGFEGWLHSFQLTRGRTFARFYRDAEKEIGTLKGFFRIYELPPPSHVVDPLLPISDRPEGLMYGLPENKPTKVLIRVYIVEAIDLAPSDVTNTADAYIVIHIGKNRLSDKDSYVSKQLNPVFGKCFEFVANFPSDSILQIQVMDWDLMGSDDLIGETKMDLENRFYSRHRPTCGLARTYEESGPNAWRDVHTPTEILTNLCQENGLGTPQVTAKDVRIANIVYNFDNNHQDDKASEENMALYLLHRWKDISPAKYSLVPEHLETRTLYHPSKPGESQGKLVMWIDMFPEDSVPPGPPRDISKRKPIGYELRVIIWNTEEVVLSDDAFLTGEKMSDIYVKGWLTGKEDTQRTDVHYRSLTGEGNFNWRFVFPFDYLPVERKMVVMKKVTVFSWDETEFKLPPKLHLQVFDADHFKHDDFLGELTLDLRRFPRGAKTVDACRLRMLEDDETAPRVSLFKQRRMRGWWPVSVESPGWERRLTGKVEAELQLFNKEEAEISPVGLGRKEPDALPEPKRPETSFVNFLHPLKTIRFALWKRYKRTMIKVIVFIALTLIILLFVYAAPGYTAKKLIGA